MKVSVCITIFNEPQESVNKLLNALDNQTLKPDEVIMVDASTKTLRFKKSNNQSKLKIKIINKTGASRAKGRNIAIKKAKNEIIAITDAGCVPHKDWLARLCSKFEIGEAGKNMVVSGAYKMVARNNFEKAEAVFLGVKQKDINSDFMPSARSMALTKSVWKRAGGFPENLNDSAEDTIFNLNLLKSGAKFVVAKNAIVDWHMPKSVYDFGFKIYSYAKGDAKSGVWWHPVKKFKTHNIKVLTIFLRYGLALLLLAIGQYDYFTIYLIIYLSFAFWKAKWWGIYLQFVSDFACIIGFGHGILQKSFKWN